MGPQVGRGERGHVHGVSERLVAGGVDEVAEDLLVVLDAAALGVAVPQEDELLLLPRPQSADALPVDLRGRRWPLSSVSSGLQRVSRALGLNEYP